MERKIGDIQTTRFMVVEQKTDWFFVSLSGTDIRRNSCKLFLRSRCLSVVGNRLNGRPITRGVDLSGSVISRATSTYRESYLRSCPESYTHRLGNFRQADYFLNVRTKAMTSRGKKLSTSRERLPPLAGKWRESTIAAARESPRERSLWSSKLQRGKVSSLRLLREWDNRRIFLPIVA